MPAMSLPHVRGILLLVWEAIAAKGAGTIPQALRTLHVACARSISSWTAVAAVAPEAEASRNASNVAATVHVSVLPRALMQKFLVWLDKFSGWLEESG